VFQWHHIIFPIADAGIDQTVDEDTVVTFNGSGSTDISGITNYTWTFRDVSPKTLYGVGPEYKFDNPGIFNVTLKVTNVFGNWNIDITTITVNDITPPVSNAGPDQIVDEGTLVAFNGSASSDNVGIVKYAWTFMDTVPVIINGVHPKHFFDRPGIFVVTLNVTDAKGNWDNDIMTVTVIDIMSPFADAGPDQTVDGGTPVAFDGSASTDNVGIVNYSWEFIDGAPVTLYRVNPTYMFDNPGIFVVKLNVTDAAGNWGTNTMTVTVIDVTAPVTNAGPDRIVDEGTLMTFDGSGSSDNIGVVNFTWTFTDGGPVTLYGARPTHKFDNPGIFLVILNATDAAGNRGADTMTVTVCDITRPVADAGPDQVTGEGAIVFFDGTESFDNVGVANYTWTFVDGAPVTLYGAQSIYIFDNPGIFTVSLNVTDAAGNWNIDTMTVTVKDITAPVADAGPDRTVDQGTVATFNGSGSSDNVGIVNYTWTFDYGTERIILHGVSPSFTFDVPGVYHVQLNVSDAAGFRGEDVMTLVVRDITPPVAVAGKDQMVPFGNIVVLDGSLSMDNCGITSYFWNFTYDGKAQSLEGRTVRFKFDKPGVYEVVLTVVDGAGNSCKDRVVITVEPTVNILPGLLWIPVLLIAVAGLAGYMVMRKRMAVKGGPSESQEEPGEIVTAKTAAAAGTPADEVETMQMDDGPQAGAGDPRLEDEATAVASVATAAALPKAVTPIPMHHVRCLNCRMRIPLYADWSGMIHCPNCGRIFRPKV
jgi:PKD repeat protein